MGGRINMIMQSAFFKLAEIIPVADAARYLKDAVEKSYGTKGQKIVDMNNAAIDQGITAAVKVAIPASWKTAQDEAAADPNVPAFIKENPHPNEPSGRR